MIDFFIVIHRRRDSPVAEKCLKYFNLLFKEDLRECCSNILNISNSYFITYHLLTSVSVNSYGSSLAFHTEHTVQEASVKNCTNEEIDLKRILAHFLSLQSGSSWIEINKSKGSLTVVRDFIGAGSLLCSLEPGDFLEVPDEIFFGSIGVPIKNLFLREMHPSSVTVCEPGENKLKIRQFSAEIISKPLEMYSFDSFEHSLHEFEAKLGKAIQRRLANFIEAGKKGFAVLFSGGVDSSLLAYLLLKYTDDSCFIELWNVAFYENVEEDVDIVPDRVLSLTSYDFLCSAFSSRSIKLLKINISKAQLDKETRSRIKYFLYPKDTFLDQSIGCALWFAASGRGTCLEKLYVVPEGRFTERSVRNYISEVNVVFSGLGPDELFAGYYKCKTLYRNKGSEFVQRKVELYVENLYERNLGRDIRCLKARKKIALFPYIDQELVQFCFRLPSIYKYDFGGSGELTDKLLIRNLCKNFGFPESVYAKAKRAIQFGSKIAKVQEKCKKASMRSSEIFLEPIE